ncbi:uncharacterized protein LOC125227757 [Leguminivora glycinivorella]|uniref:uncharacterized protein LOC125227757 n=1 Tax=Leguminivora glycinivorella TaxID=1035111 RepID=UPI0020100444|nr:uncharacterized protein LOC125227757 [Leguminivora glycinivorella]
MYSVQSSVNRYYSFSMHKSTLNSILPRLKKLFFLGMMLGCGSVVLLVLNTDQRFYMEYNSWDYLKRQYAVPYKSDNSSTIRTEGCRIPFMQADEKSIRKMAKDIHEMRPCVSHPLLNSNSTHVWIVKENLVYYNLSTSSNLTCCYKSFYRPISIDDITASDIDDRVKYNSCRNFSDIIDVNDEFVRVVCNETKILFDTFYVFAREENIVATSQKHLPYNVLILGIDAVSRINLHRTMPKTVNFLKKLGSVEFLGYNKVGDNTFPNLIPLLLGKEDTELEDTCWPNSKSTFDNCPFIWERYQNAGFVTALAEDTSWLGTFNYANKRGFASSPTNYYLHTFIHEAERIAGTNKDGNSKLCMNEKFFYNILVDYVKDLTTILKSKLFGFFWETTMSHDRLNYPIMMDDSYNDLFRKMYMSGYLNQTIVFLMSDHGMRWGTFRSTKQGFLEDRLPFVIALMPPSFRYNYTQAYNNLQINSHRLTTPFDMHATLTDLINLENIDNAKIISRRYDTYATKRGISLFLPIPGNRTCQSAAIDDHWCTCYRYTKIKSNSRVAKEAVKQVESHINGLLKDYHQCAQLTILEVLEVTRLLPGSFRESKKDFIQLTVVVRTNPGGGEFEATIGREGGRGGKWTVAGSVSRLNLYGNQSYCVPTSELKLYCYCVNSTLSTTNRADFIN